MFQNTDQIKMAHKGRFFSTSNMRTFNTRVLPTVYHGKYFITSERPDHRLSERRYTVRQAAPDGEINTVGEFMGHRTRAAAIRAIKEHYGNTD